MSDPTRTFDGPATASLAKSVGTTAASGPSVGGGAVVAPSGYDLLGEVGRGGMGVVYRARDLALDREVAVKILLDKYAPDSGTARRFVDEARITGQLQHPGIPAVYQVGTLPDGRPFLAMKLIKGETLDERLKEQGAGSTKWLGTFEGICQAVGYAHAHGVIHRDLKPANVMVGSFGEVQVMDWGLAKVLAPGTRSVSDGVDDPDATALVGTEIKSLRDADLLTQYGSILGTPAFMPPEQAAGELDKVGTRSDVFGLGAVLCVLLTGKPPFDGKDAESVRINAVRGKTDEAFARLDGCGADPDVIALCKRCLAFEPTDRPATADEVASAVAALRRAADDRALLAERDKLAAEVRAGEQAKRRRVVQRAAVIAATVFVTGLAGTTLGMLRAEERRWEAEQVRQGEADQRRNAETARADALAKAAEAEAMVKFFEDRVLVAARPEGLDGGLGKDVTLRDAIAASLPALATEFAGRPLVEAQLRLTLGTTFRHLDENQAAVDQFLRARAIRAERFGPDHPDTLRIDADLGTAYRTLGRRADGLRLLEATVATQRRVLPEDHPDTLHSLELLAISLSREGRDLEALRIREHVRDARQRVLHPDHPDMIKSTAAVGGSLFAQGRYQESLAVRLEVLAARRRTLRPNDPAISDSLMGIAQLQMALGRPDEALKLAEEVLAARRRIYPENHRLTLVTQAVVANMYTALGRHAEAIRLQNAALTGRLRVLGPDHQETLQSLNFLGVSLAAAGRHAEALKWQQDALAARLRNFPPDDRDTLFTRWRIAECLVHLNRGAEAIPLIDECVAKGAGLTVHPEMVPSAMDLRLRHFRQASDPAGCRATAEMWEELNRPDAASLYNAIRFRAVTAGLYAKSGQPAEATADADKAMAWLNKAVEAGWKDAAHIKTDKDLDPLRARDDFQKLLADLETKFPPKPEVLPPPRRE